ncbi:MAG TPA: hypothetical protein VEK79_15845 [Thermoanaerobaculia bacterium]|nr:hypothetical protein [Thermoanaerobaculia bacterium]
MIARVGDVQDRGGRDHNGARSVEERLRGSTITVAGTASPRDCRDVAGWRDHADLAVPSVGDIKVADGIHRETSRFLEARRATDAFAVLRTTGAGERADRTVEGHPPDDVIARVGDVDQPPFRIDRNSLWLFESRLRA